MGKPMPSASNALEAGRRAFAGRAWSDAYRELSAANRAAALDPEDLERLATSAHLIGHDAESVDLRTRAHQDFARRGDIESAARAAFWLGFQLMMSGEGARVGGWLGRAQRLLEDSAIDSVVSGYVLFATAVRRAVGGDPSDALPMFATALDIGTRFGDDQLVIMARHGQGRGLIALGRCAEGMGLLDEVMVAVTAGEISPLAIGPIYCSLLDACHEMLDWRRAQEWTEVLSRWFTSEPDLVPFRGQCLVHRAEIMRMHGEWPSAMDEAGQACTLLGKPPAHPAAGAAYYQQGELQRLSGDFSSAAESYRMASQYGRQPQPGLALLRLAQGQVDVAVAAIRHVIDEPHARPTRAAAFAACAEIMLASNDIGSARRAADRLATLRAASETPSMRALCATTVGGLLLAEGDARGAVMALDEAQRAWAEVGAPYEIARVRVLIGLANRALGDDEMARLELEAARDVFERLGAKPDVERVLRFLAQPRDARRWGADVSRGGGARVCSRRAGPTEPSRSALAISEKTVARHVATSSPSSA